MSETKNKRIIIKTIFVIFVMILLKLFLDYFSCNLLFKTTLQESYHEDYFGKFCPLTQDIQINVQSNKTYIVTEHITSKDRMLYKNIPLANSMGEKVFITNAAILNSSYRRSKSKNFLKLRSNIAVHTPNTLYTYDIYYKHSAPDDHDKEYDFFNIILLDTSWKQPYNGLTIKLNMPKIFDPSCVQLTDMYGNAIINPQIGLVSEGNVLTITLDKNTPLNNGLALSAKLPEGYFSKNWIYTIFAENKWILIWIVVFVIACLSWLLLANKKTIEYVHITKPIKHLNPVETGYLYHQHAKSSLIALLFIYWATKDIITIENAYDGSIKVSRHKSLSDNHRKYEYLLFSKIFKKGVPIVSLQTLKPDFYKIIKDVKKGLDTYISSPNKGLFKSGKFLTKHILKAAISLHLILLFSLYLIDGITFWSVLIIILNLALISIIRILSVNFFVFFKQVNETIQEVSKQHWIFQLFKFACALAFFSLLSFTKAYGGFNISSFAEILC